MTAPASQRGKRKRGYALFAATVAAWATFFGLSWLVAMTGRVLAENDTAQSMPADVIVVAAIFGFPVTLLVCFVIGVMALAFVEVLKLFRWWQMALTGAGCGVLVALALLLGGALPSSAWLKSISVLSVGGTLFALTGAAAGVAAWASLMLDDQANNMRRKIT